MRRLATVLLVLLVLLGAGFVVVDRLLVARTEDRLLAEARGWADLAQGSEIEIDGFPFLTQVAAGRLAEVRGLAPALVVEGRELQDVRVAVRGVAPTEPYPAENVEINAGIPVATLRAAVTEAMGLPGDPLRLDAADGLLQLGVEVAGLRLDALVEPVVVDGAVGLRLGEVVLGDAQVPRDVVDLLAGALDEVRVDVPGLPAGLAPTRLAVDEDGLQVRLEGTDVELGEWLG